MFYLVLYNPTLPSRKKQNREKRGNDRCLYSTLSLRVIFISFRIRGTTAVELASGLHWYLKYSCGAHVSWDKTGGIQIASVPNSGSLPHVKDEGVIIQRPVPWNYYQNVVTSSCEYRLNLPAFHFQQIGVVIYYCITSDKIK